MNVLLCCLCVLLYLNYVNLEGCKNCKRESCNQEIIVEICTNSMSSYSNNIKRICIDKETLGKDAGSLKIGTVLKCKTVCDYHSQQKVKLFVCNPHVSNKLNVTSKLTPQQISTPNKTKAQKFFTQKPVVKKNLVQRNVSAQQMDTTINSIYLTISTEAPNVVNMTHLLESKVLFNPLPAKDLDTNHSISPHNITNNYFTLKLEQLTSNLSTLSYPFANSYLKVYPTVSNKKVALINKGVSAVTPKFLTILFTTRTTTLSPTIVTNLTDTTNSTFSNNLTDSMNQTNITDPTNLTNLTNTTSVMSPTFPTIPIIPPGNKISPNTLAIQSTTVLPILQKPSDSISTNCTMYSNSLIKTSSFLLKPSTSTSPLTLPSPLIQKVSLDQSSSLLSISSTNTPSHVIPLCSSLSPNPVIPPYSLMPQSSSISPYFIMPPSTSISSSTAVPSVSIITPSSTTSTISNTTVKPTISNTTVKPTITSTPILTKPTVSVSSNVITPSNLSPLLPVNLSATQSFLDLTNPINLKSLTPTTDLPLANGNSSIKKLIIPSSSLLINPWNLTNTTENTNTTEDFLLSTLLKDLTFPTYQKIQNNLTDINPTNSRYPTVFSLSIRSITPDFANPTASILSLNLNNFLNDTTNSTGNYMSLNTSIDPTEYLLHPPNLISTSTTKLINNSIILKKNPKNVENVTTKPFLTSLLKNINATFVEDTQTETASVTTPGFKFELHSQTTPRNNFLENSEVNPFYYHLYPQTNNVTNHKKTTALNQRISQPIIIDNSLKSSVVNSELETSDPLPRIQDIDLSQLPTLSELLIKQTKGILTNSSSLLQMYTAETDSTNKKVQSSTRYFLEVSSTPSGEFDNIFETETEPRDVNELYSFLKIKHYKQQKSESLQNHHGKPPYPWKIIDTLAKDLPVPEIYTTVKDPWHFNRISTTTSESWEILNILPTSSTPATTTVQHTKVTTLDPIDLRFSYIRKSQKLNSIPSWLTSAHPISWTVPTMFVTKPTFWNASNMTLYPLIETTTANSLPAWYRSLDWFHENSVLMSTASTPDGIKSGSPVNSVTTLNTESTTINPIDQTTDSVPSTTDEFTDTSVTSEPPLLTTAQFDTTKKIDSWYDLISLDSKHFEPDIISTIQPTTSIGVSRGTSPVEDLSLDISQTNNDVDAWFDFIHPKTLPYSNFDSESSTTSTVSSLKPILISSTDSIDLWYQYNTRNPGYPIFGDSPTTVPLVNLKSLVYNSEFVNGKSTSILPTSIPKPTTRRSSNSWNGFDTSYSSLPSKKTQGLTYKFTKHKPIAGIKSDPKVLGTSAATTLPTLTPTNTIINQWTFEDPNAIYKLTSLSDTSTPTSYYKSELFFPWAIQNKDLMINTPTNIVVTTTTKIPQKDDFQLPYYLTRRLTADATTVSPMFTESYPLPTDPILANSIQPWYNNKMLSDENRMSFQGKYKPRSLDIKKTEFPLSNVSIQPKIRNSRSHSPQRFYNYSPGRHSIRKKVPFKDTITLHTGNAPGKLIFVKKNLKSTGTRISVKKRQVYEKDAPNSTSNHIPTKYYWKTSNFIKSLINIDPILTIGNTTQLKRTSPLFLLSVYLVPINLTVSSKHLPVNNTTVHLPEHFLNTSNKIASVDYTHHKLYSEDALKFINQTESMVISSTESLNRRRNLKNLDSAALNTNNQQSNPEFILPSKFLPTGFKEIESIPDSLNTSAKIASISEPPLTINRSTKIRYKQATFNSPFKENKLNSEYNLKFSTIEPPSNLDTLTDSNKDQFKDLSNIKSVKSVPTPDFFNSISSFNPFKTVKKIMEPTSALLDQNSVTKHRERDKSFLKSTLKPFIKIESTVESKYTPKDILNNSETTSDIFLKMGRLAYLPQKNRQGYAFRTIPNNKHFIFNLAPTIPIQSTNSLLTEKLKQKDPFTINFSFNNDYVTNIPNLIDSKTGELLTKNNYTQFKRNSNPLSINVFPTKTKFNYTKDIDSLLSNPKSKRQLTLYVPKRYLTSSSSLYSNVTSKKKSKIELNSSPSWLQILSSIVDSTSTPTLVTSTSSATLTGYDITDISTTATKQNKIKHYPSKILLTTNKIQTFPYIPSIRTQTTRGFKTSSSTILTRHFNSTAYLTRRLNDTKPLTNLPKNKFTNKHQVEPELTVSNKNTTIDYSDGKARYITPLRNKIRHTIDKVPITDFSSTSLDRFSNSAPGRQVTIDFQGRPTTAVEPQRVSSNWMPFPYPTFIRPLDIRSTNFYLPTVATITDLNVYELEQPQPEGKNISFPKRVYTLPWPKSTDLNYFDWKLMYPVGYFNPMKDASVTSNPLSETETKGKDVGINWFPSRRTIPVEILTTTSRPSLIQVPPEIYSTRKTDQPSLPELPLKFYRTTEAYKPLTTKQHQNTVSINKADITTISSNKSHYFSTITPYHFFGIQPTQTVSPKISNKSDYCSTITPYHFFGIQPNQTVSPKIIKFKKHNNDSSRDVKFQSFLKSENKSLKKTPEKDLLKICERIYAYSSTKLPEWVLTSQISSTTVATLATTTTKKRKTKPRIMSSSRPMKKYNWFTTETIPDWLTARYGAGPVAKSLYSTSKITQKPVRRKVRRKNKPRWIRLRSKKYKKPIWVFSRKSLPIQLQLKRRKHRHHSFFRSLRNTHRLLRTSRYVRSKSNPIPVKHIESLNNNHSNNNKASYVDQMVYWTLVI